MITDIAIGFIIGVGAERAVKVSYMAQKAIKKFQENQRKERQRKKDLINAEYGKAVKNANQPENKP